MAAPATEELRELARELTIAAEQGETRRFDELREQLGMGHEDLEQALGTLREHGQAVEASPGEWRGPLMDELEGGRPAGADDDERVRVSVPDASEAGEEEEPAQAGGAALDFLAPGDATVRLNRAIADALDDESLGKIVKAGLAGSGDEVFVLEVLP